MLHQEIRKKVLILSPTAEIDAHSTERLRTTIDHAFEKSPCTHMVFDFANVGFMDSSGIGLLIGRYKQAEKRGGSVALVNLSAEMKRLYTLSGLAKIIASFPTMDEALAHVKGGAV